MLEENNPLIVPPAPKLRSNLNQSNKRGDRIAVIIANTFGSVVFLLICILFFIIWITWNLNFIHGLKRFDPFPFPELEMVVSIFAIILSVAVLISQNRQRRIEKIKEEVEFEVNLHAEAEITKMLGMLHEIQKKLGIENTDIELEKMKETLDLDALHEKLDKG